MVVVVGLVVAVAPASLFHFPVFLLAAPLPAPRPRLAGVARAAATTAAAAAAAAAAVAALAASASASTVALRPALRTVKKKENRRAAVRESVSHESMHVVYVSVVLMLESIKIVCIRERNGTFWGSCV